MKIRNLKNNKILGVLTLAMALAIFAPNSAAFALVELDEDGQGKGNKGTTFVPVDTNGDPANFTMSGRTSIDENSPFVHNASGLQGTVYIDDKGAGVQTLDGGGSKGISGGGGDKDEELIFIYNAPVQLYSVLIGLNDIEFGKGLDDKDDPVIFINTSGGSVLTALESAISNAFTSTGKKMGTVDFSKLGFADTSITSFAVRETNGHTYVNLEGSETGTVPVPEPGTILLLGSGLATSAFSKYRKKQKANNA